MTNGQAPAKAWLEREGALLRLRLARPKANIIDAAMTAALAGAFARFSDAADLRAVLLDHDGPNFSFGASVEEHLPDQCKAMLEGFHGLIAQLLDFPVPVLVAAQGQCLGGGLEVATAGTLLFAAPDTKLGQPEMQLGVFAPAASCLLPARIGQAAAEELLYSGRIMGAEEAESMDLVHEIAEDPEAAALGYFDRHLAPKSASSLRFATAATRADFAARMKERLRAVEALYLDGLMATRDASEGLEAFLEKRPAKWENR